MSKWDTRYVVNANTGKAFKVSELSLREVNSHIASYKSKIKTTKIGLDKLYEKRAILLGEPVEPEKAKRKIAEDLKIKGVTPEKEQRYKQILLLALNVLEKNKDLALVEAILKQARDEE